jgi:hypothetical protein
MSNFSDVVKHLNDNFKIRSNVKKVLRTSSNKFATFSRKPIVIFLLDGRVGQSWSHIFNICLRERKYDRKKIKIRKKKKSDLPCYLFYNKVLENHFFEKIRKARRRPNSILT